MSGRKNVYISFVVIAFGGLLFGYIIGVNSNIVTTGQLLCPKDWNGPVGDWTSFGYDQCYKLGPWSEGLLSSLNLIGACLASLFCMRFADDIGRKREVQLGALFYMIGAIVTAVSPALFGIFIGFGIYGFGIGLAMHAAPVYIAEISPADIRGTLVSAKEAIIVLGMFMGFLFGYIFSNWEASGWRYMIALPTLFALCMGVGVSMIAESPRFLVMKSVTDALLAEQGTYMEKARVALEFYRPGEDVRAELQTMRDDITTALSGSRTHWTDAFRYKKQLLVGCGIVLLQQITGQPSVLYFATNIFKDAGFGSAAALSSVGVGFVKLLATLFTVWRVDRYGRRVLLFVGISMMVFALAILSVAFTFQYCQAPNTKIADCDEDHIALPHTWALATVAALCVYVSGYQVGFGPIAWCLISEIFPQSARGSAMSIAAMTNFGGNITISLTLVALQKALTPAGNFGMYLVFSVVSILFVHFLVPETKGKTLEEIQGLFDKRTVDIKA